MSVEEARKALEQRNKKKVDPAVAKARQALEKRNMPTSGFNSMPGNRIASIGEITRPARQAVTGVGKSFAGVGSWALRNTIDPLLRKTGLNIQGALSTEDVRAKGGFETAGKIVGDILYGSAITGPVLGFMGTAGTNLGTALKIAPKGMQALGYTGRIGAAGATEYGLSRIQGYTDKESKISAAIASAIPALSPVLRGVASEWTTKGAIKKAQSAYDEIFTGTKTGSKMLAKSTKAGKQTSKFLAENGFLVKVERGGRINADDTIKQIVDRAEQFEDIYQRTLEETDRFLPTSKYHNLDDYARALKKRMTTPTNKGTGDIERIYDEIDRLIGTFKRTFGENVNNSTMNLIKRGQWRATNVFDATKPAYVSDINYNAGKVAKDFLEKNIDDVDIRAMNGFLGDHWDAVKMLKTINYSKVKGGRLGNYFARTIGAVAGAKGGPVGSLVGAEVGDKVSTIMQANTLGSPLQRYLLKQISPADAEFAKAQEALSALVGKNIERVASQKALPAGKTIFAGPKTPPQGAQTKVLTPHKGTGRDPLTGKFKRVFKSTGDALNEVTPGLSTKTPVYKGEKDLTTKILKDLEGKTTNVSDFAKKVKAGLLPLKRGIPKGEIFRGDTSKLTLKELDTTKVFNPAEKEALGAFNNTPGLYFTDSLDNAKSYGKNITKVSVNPESLVIDVQDAPKVLKRKDVEKIIRSNPRIEDWAMNWSENFDDAIKQITDSVVSEKDGNEFLKAIWSDGGFSESDFVVAMKNFGIDGIKVKKDGVNHYVIYNKDVLR